MSPRDGIERDCTFCEALSEPSIPFEASEPLGEGNVSIMPALGMLVPGHMLVVSNEHLTSFAQMDSSDLREVGSSIDEIEAELTPIFGEYFRSESGSDNITDYGGSGGCIEHAHQRLLPAADVGSRIFDMLPWEQIDGYEELERYRGKPYIYLGRAGTHFVIPTPRLHGQWVRRQFASMRNLESWDWALQDARPELLVTLRKLGEAGILSQLAQTASEFPIGS